MNKHNFINVWMFKGFLLLRESEQKMFSYLTYFLEVQISHTFSNWCKNVHMLVFFSSSFMYNTM